MEPIKVSAASLPPGAKEGDMLQLRIKGTDPTTDMVLLEPVHDEEESQPMDSVEGEPEGDEPTAPSMDTKTLLGPMSGLKNYLVQKSQDVPKNQGR